MRLRVPALCAVLLLLAGGCSRAQPDPVFSRMSALSLPPSGARMVSTGTGFFVGGDGLLLTAAHLVKDCRRIDIWGPDGSTQDARALRADVAADVAVMLIEGAPRVALPMARMAPPDSRMLVYGYPDDSTRERAVLIPAVGINAIARGYNPSAPPSTEQLIIRATIRHGDSGGPIVNEAGQVVGLIHGILDRPDDVQRYYGFRANDVAVGPGLVPILRLIGGLPAVAGAKGTPDQAVVRVICWN